MTTMNSLTDASINDRGKETLLARRQLWNARRRMSTEAIFLINELSTELYTSLAVIISGVILRDSSVVTLINTELTWDTLPFFFGVQSIPELLDAWFVVVYLRYLGIDFWAFWKSMVLDRRFLAAKVLSVLISFVWVVGMSIDTD